VSTLLLEVARCRSVVVDVVGAAVLPAAPQDARPGAAEDADRVGVVAAAVAGASVDVAGPGVPVAGAVGERGEVVAQAFVACPAEDGGAAFAGLDGDGSHAGVGRERVGGAVAVAVVADLGEQAGGADDALGVAEQAEEDRAVAMGADGAGDLAGLG
jgi:hypothetical protein